MQIIIADDHPVILMGLTALLKSQGGTFHVVGEAHAAEDLMKLLVAQPCDLLITDFSMPDENGANDGLPMLRRIRRDHPDLPIIVLTMVRNATLIRGMLGIGVQGVVNKASFTTELLLAIHAVVSGRTYLGEDLRHAGDPKHRSQRAGSGKTEEVVLSAREAEVVRLFSGGLSVTQIADKVHRSVKTVSQQKNDAMRKLGITSHAELFQYAKAYGLVS